MVLRCQGGPLGHCLHADGCEGTVSIYKVVKRDAPWIHVRSAVLERSYGELSDCSCIVVFRRQSVLWVTPHWMLLHSVVLPPSLGILVFLGVSSSLGRLFLKETTRFEH